MKRFASHYTYIPSYGFLKQYVVGINNEGVVVTLYPLREEVESIIWTPGVIRLMPHTSHFEDYNLSTFDVVEVRKELPFQYKDIAVLGLAAIRIYPFDFIQMKPVESSMYQVLDNRTF